MKLPPDQVAATVLTPLKRSRTAITLVAGVFGVPCVAYHEIIRWVTSWGWNAPPLMPQMVRGLLALETSASTGCAAPCSLITASWAAGVPAQLARWAAQAGTATGGGFGLGVAEIEAGERLASGARGPLGVQQTAATRKRRRPTPILTGGWNEQRCAWVTGSPWLRKSPRIPPDPLAQG